MINENTTFKEYLKESGYTMEQYKKEVRNAAIKINPTYRDIDLYYSDEIEEAFEEDVSINEITAKVCSLFDEEFSNKEVPEDIDSFGNEFDDEYTQDQLDAFDEYPQDVFEDDLEESIKLEEYDTIVVPDYMYVAYENNDYSGLEDSEIEEMTEFFKQYESCTFEVIEEPDFHRTNDVNGLGGNCYVLKVYKRKQMTETTETKKEEKPDDEISDGESYKDWKLNVFKYIDKRLDVDKVKELGTYIKDFIKQEYDNGEPSWFGVAESIVNYTRINYPQCVKSRIPYNLDEGFLNFKKFHNNPYINKALSILKKKDIDIDTNRDEIVDYIEQFMEEGSDIWETTDCAFQHFYKYRTI